MSRPKITITAPDVTGPLAFVNVEFGEDLERHQARATVGVFVANSDSISERHERAVQAALAFMQRTLDEHATR